MSTLDATKGPLQIILMLCQYVINKTRQQCTVEDLSCRATPNPVFCFHSVSFIFFSFFCQSVFIITFILVWSKPIQSYFGCHKWASTLDYCCEYLWILLRMMSLVYGNKIWYIDVIIKCIIILIHCTHISKDCRTGSCPSLI